jgi:hypothetical protein
MNPLYSLPEYERFVYSLAQHFPVIRRSTLVVVRRGAAIAVVNGEVELAGGIRLIVREKLSFAQAPGKLIGYGYEIWRGEEELYWYDSQEHPNDPTLASTDPHHKHIPPDIKHHRIPAPGLSFDQPNLPFLIAEIERELANRD